MSSYYNPVHAHFGIGCITNLGDMIHNVWEGNGLPRILLVTGARSLAEGRDYDSILSSINKNAMHLTIYKEVRSRPTLDDVVAAHHKLAVKDVDMIIAIGGGSVIDFAKLLKATSRTMIDSKDELRDALTNGKLRVRGSETTIIAVPTTSGTGSEATPWATLWDLDLKRKYSVEDRALFPQMAILDPNLTISMPTKLTVTTALDALSHSVEAFWAKNTNDVSRIYSLKAIDSIIGNLNKAVQDGSDVMARKSLLMASYFAGMAFSNTRTTACHAISYPLTARFNLDHGVAVAMTLGRLLEWNKNMIDDVHSLLNCFSDGGHPSLDEFVRSALISVDLPTRLRDYGIPEDALLQLSKEGISPGRSDNNPRHLTQEDIYAILREIY
jgi:alcohol dehydrogenase class IV